MKILCAIGSRGGAELVRRILPSAAALGADLLLVHVIDLGPRHELEHLPGPLLHRGPHGGPERTQAMDAAETAAGQRALAEALAVAQAGGLTAQSRLERGKPEQAIVALARETGADRIVIRARQSPEHHPPLGPGSVGHTARFVLDHAPCDVLLVRTLTML
ncbi:MAG TPA: universal stress protein [Ktedonobacterales bacterium]